MKDIGNKEDIELMVHSFYERIRVDNFIGPIFNEVIKDNWPKHLDTMCRFWQTILLDEYTYKGSPFAPHRKLPIEAIHFERWLYLFNASMDEHFTGEKALEAKWRAKKMAEMFQYKLSANSL